MKVFGGSILSHYSRWCPVQARLVQSLETKWEGKRERQRKAKKREKDVGYSLNSLFVSVIYTSKIVLGGKGLTNSFFPHPHRRIQHTHRHHPGCIGLLGCIRKAKLGCCSFFFFSFLGLSNSSIASAQVQRWTFPIISMLLHPELPPGSLTGATLAPGRPGTLPSCSSAAPLPKHTHTHKPSAPLLEGPADPHLIPIHGGGGVVLI